MSNFRIPPYTIHHIKNPDGTYGTTRTVFNGGAYYRDAVLGQMRTVHVLDVPQGALATLGKSAARGTKVGTQRTVYDVATPSDKKDAIGRAREIFPLKKVKMAVKANSVSGEMRIYIGPSLRCGCCAAVCYLSSSTSA